MITLWRAYYNDLTWFDGPDSRYIDRSKLDTFEVRWGPDTNHLEKFELIVPTGIRLVYRKRQGVNIGDSQRPDDNIEFAIAALETKDRSYARVHILHCEGGRAKVWAQDNYHGPNLHMPDLWPEEL